ncbi:putative tyrosyl-tRNA synthetase [Trypanosoma rangeli]|uniref:Putative tyrosyl-tRNA synthetase n=1 Tax=Trypanosoma rangeli TaxID=5698 RepID=A0A3R7KNR3_TRYRA|nr:putative tyrosyl-tRNA synthetase [Trypanosoma rangeli]RNE98279.1 putative tyrosyl-tRNA synthetase [Trypanosoma rangeli]|eukprot:RNE98279.1 putative tyrosyl-tRNA synthetase [Trypanosoma rangeli]
MSHKYILQGNSPLRKAVECLLQMFSVPADHVIAEGEHFAVKDGLMTHVGILPLLTVLRSTTQNAELQAFVGVEAEVRPLVNQWVSTALLLSADVVSDRAISCTTTPLARHVFAEVERCVESFGLKQSFLAGTPRATVADFLLYAAIHGYPNGLTEALPSTLAWSLHAQSDAYLAPILSKSGAEALAAAKAPNAKKVVYARPSVEEILRRRQEKEKEKQAKLAQTAKSSTSATSSGAQEGNAQKKSESEDADAALGPNRLSIRVGRFNKVERHPDADRLYVEEMDLGSEKRTIVSGLVEHYKAEELEGSLCLIVCNMKPKPLKGITSEGMVLCASKTDTLRLVRPPEGAKPGDRIMFADAFNADAPEEMKQLSGNVMSGLIGFLHTDHEGVLHWRDVPAQHANGVIRVPDVTNAVVR